MNFSRIILLLISLLLVSCVTIAQQSLQIIVRNADKSTLPGATVQLTRFDDSAKFNSITNLDGIAEFGRLRYGNYLLRLSFMGYKPLETRIKVSAAKLSHEFTLHAESLTLGEVTITAKKPLIRQEEDKMIIDPEPIANTSTNTLEVLESTPGLYVDPDGAIYLSTTTPAAIYINGREQKMSSQDISNILRNLPPNSVEKIEVLRVPSTKYDAASSGGIINIVLKKGVKIGRFGSVNTGLNQGKYGNRFVGFSLNNGGINSSGYLNLNYSNNNQYDELSSRRFLSTDTSLNQVSNTLSSNDQLSLGYGLSYEPKKKISFSYDGRISSNLRNSSTDNDNHFDRSGKFILSNSYNHALNDVKSLNVQQETGMKILLDTLESALDFKLSYNFNHNNSNQQYTTQFKFPFDSLIEGNGENRQNRHFLVFQSDLTYQLPLQIKLEAGIKGSWQYYESNADFFIKNGSIQVRDTKRTNRYNYSETIHAAYLQASRLLFAGMHLKSGVRMEFTNMNGHQRLPGDTNFRVNRTDWFPYVYLSRKVFKIMGAELFGYIIYRKTINRPGYQELNPYSRYIDQFLFEAGNPALKPQFTDNIEFNISFEDMPVFAIGRNTTRDIFSMVMYNDDRNGNTLIRTYDNLGKNWETYFRGMIGIPPGGKYFFALGAQFNLNKYDGFYDSQPLHYSRDSWRFFTFHSLSLFKETKLTVNGFLMTNGQWNFYEMKTFGQLSMGITQTLLDKKLIITINARDILKTMTTDFTFRQGNIMSEGSRYSDNRRFGINIRYNFGIRKKDEGKSIPGFEEPEI